MQTPLPALLFTHATRYAMPFMTAHGQLCAAVPNGAGAHAIWPLRSHRFRDWLAHTFFTEHERFPSRRALDNAISMLEAQATHSALPHHLVDRRLSHRGNPRHPDAILLDLANDKNDKNEAIEITAAGWTIVESDSFFQRDPQQHPLPAPRHPATPGFPLDALLPAATSAGRIQIVAWLLNARRPIGPYPILILQGPPGSAKSTTARLLRAILDPAASPFSPKPASESHLHRIAWNNRILAFDHVTSLSRAQAASLARIATGSGFCIPETHISVDFQRPIVITVPDDFEIPRHLQSSAFVVELRLTHHRQESQIFHDFEQLHPLALGALLDATSTALANFDKLNAESDLIAWTTAAAPALALSATDIAAGAHSK